MSSMNTLTIDEEQQYWFDLQLEIINRLIFIGEFDLSDRLINEHQSPALLSQAHVFAIIFLGNRTTAYILQLKHCLAVILCIFLKYFEIPKRKKNQKHKKGKRFVIQGSVYGMPMRKYRCILSESYS